LKLVVVGAGGHAKVVVATARAAGREIAAVLDDDPDRFKTDFCGLSVEGPIHSSLADFRDAEVILAIGDNRARFQLAASISLPFATIVHPFAWVARDVKLGEGTVVFAGTVLQPAVRIGRHCVLNTSCSVDHDCTLDDFSQVAPGARLAGAVTVCEGAYIGMGACVIQALNVGAWSVVGAGAAVVRDVVPDTVVKGVPARSGT
jgi:sugar O-acyltransferase (sialic acid O-acetyltransferase NeuD family)